jgi:hypothetical protein
MREIFIGKEIELVQEVADVDATQGIHLRKRQNTWKPKQVSEENANLKIETVDVHLFLPWLLRIVPADVEDLVVLLQRLYRHGHIIIRGYDLTIQVSKDKLIMILRRTSWKSSLNLFLRSSAYLLNKVKSNSSNVPTENSHVCVKQWSVMESKNMRDSSEVIDRHSSFA